MREVTQGAIVHQMAAGAFRITETVHPGRLELRPHEHENPNINIVLDGGLEERVQEHAHTCLPGSMLLKPAGARHSNRYGNGPTRCLILEFDQALCLRGDAAILFRPGPADGMLAHAIETELRQPDIATALILEGLALQLLGSLKRQERTAERQVPAWLRKVREMLDASGPGACTLAQLASAVGVDRTHLSKTFRRHFHLSPGAYLRRQRVSKAANLIRAGGRVADIAAACGFADQSHFSKVFHAHMRLTPGRYRRRWALKHTKTPQ